MCPGHENRPRHSGPRYMVPRLGLRDWLGSVLSAPPRRHVLTARVHAPAAFSLGLRQDRSAPLLHYHPPSLHAAPSLTRCMLRSSTNSGVRLMRRPSAPHISVALAQLCLSAPAPWACACRGEVMAAACVGDLPLIHLRATALRSRHDTAVTLCGPLERAIRTCKDGGAFR